MVTHGPPEGAEAPDAFERERPAIQTRLEHLFPESNAETVSAAIEAAPQATEGAKIQSYRALLVEHRASEILRWNASSQSASSS
jgi:hypothetical protein